MKRLPAILVVVAVVVAFVIFLGPFYIVQEGEQAVRIRFGEIIDSTQDAGLHFRTPIVDRIAKYSAKLLAWDGDPRRMPTSENQFIWVDTTARWSISDPELFNRSVTTMENAYSRLDDIVESAVRTVVSSNALEEAVRDSNVINEIDRSPSITPNANEESDERLREIENLLTVVETRTEIESGRQMLSNEMLQRARETAGELGIELHDIIIRQIRYSDDLTDSVYERMVSERLQIAQAYRSYGEGRKQELIGQMENERRSILSEAYERAETIRGSADAQAAQIYSDAYRQDPAFFEFWRAIESYRKTLRSSAKHSLRICSTSITSTRKMVRKTTVRPNQRGEMHNSPRFSPPIDQFALQGCATPATMLNYDSENAFQYRKNYAILESIGDTNLQISHVTYDSRAAGTGTLFVALPGIHVDGHDYIADATERGARAVVCQTIPKKLDSSTCYLRVADSRAALSALSAELFDHPSRTIPVIGVTGTDGKTTTTFLIDQLLSLSDEESGFISTALIKRDLKLEKNPFRQSTPEAPEIHTILNDMIESGKRYAVVEATSHGLSDKTTRLKDICFQVGVFTNLTHEHLEFHGSFEQYRSDKANLFRSLDRTHNLAPHREMVVFGVINADDPNAYYFRRATKQAVFSYSVAGNQADLVATDLQPDTRGTTCKIRWRGEVRSARIPLTGLFNVENVLAAMLVVAKLTDRNPLDLVELLPELRAVPGRMHVISHTTPFVPIVDYAHTPGAFEKVLPMIKRYTDNRLIVLFGSAGERDIKKRAMQGGIAAKHADVVVLTDEDPRGEDSEVIINDIATGCLHQKPAMESNGNLFRIPDRRKAIRHSLSIAQAGDTILFLGKGHESSIIYRDGAINWDEAQVVREELTSLAKKEIFR